MKSTKLNKILCTCIETKSVNVDGSCFWSVMFVPFLFYKCKWDMKEKTERF